MIRKVENGVPRERSGSTVLVVDDEEMVRLVTVRMLQFSGFRTVEAEDGPSALELLEKDRASGSRRPQIDAVILDWSMPGMSGEDTYREIHRNHSKVPVLISTGWSPDDTRRSLSDLGRVHIVSKPFDAATLSLAISERIDRTQEA